MRHVYSKTIMLEGRTEDEVERIMEGCIDRALASDYFVKEIKYCESVIVLIFERNPK